MEFEDVNSDIESVVLTKEQIAEGIARIAREIENNHTGHTPLLIGVLKGAVMVMADLARELHIPIEMDWMAVSSYGASTNPAVWCGSSKTSKFHSRAAMSSSLRTLSTQG